MTEEVAGLVLADNDHQSRALTLDGIRSASRYEDFVALVEEMVSAGILSRADDAIPTREELLAQRELGRGLPRPLLAVLLGHTKMWAFEKVMETEFPESPAGEPFLQAYFPRRLREGFAEHLGSHPLRREIAATAAVNHLVNHAGVTFLSRVMASSKAAIGEVVTTYVDLDRESQARALRESLLESGLDVRGEHEALIEVEDALAKATLTVLQGERVDPSHALDPVRSALRH